MCSQRETHAFISYFSPKIQNDFISLLVKHIKQKQVDDYVEAN